MELIIGLALGLTAAVVGVWRITARDRPIHGPPPDGHYTFPTIQRWSDESRRQRFAGVRRVMPRFEVSRLVLGAGLVIVLALVSAVTFLLIRDRGAVPDQATVQSKLGGIVAVHADANVATDPTIAYELLLEAKERSESFIDDFPEGAVDAQVLEEYQSILNDLDALTRMSRLETVQPVGGVPPAPAGVNPQMFSGDGRLFLLTDALYQIDTTTASLVRLLGAGDVVGGVEVGTLLGAAWRSDGPLVLDSTTAYTLDLTSGTWTVEGLGTSDEVGPLTVTAMDIFDFNLYILDADNGRILKFAGGDYEAPPEDWAASQSSAELAKGTDLLVDGNIYVTMADGSILRFFLSTLDSVLVPNIVPPFDAVDALVANFDGEYLYQVNRSDGRIARIDREGSLVQQFSGAVKTADLTGVEDIVIDEDTGVAYLLSANTIYTTRLTNPVEGSSP